MHVNEKDSGLGKCYMERLVYFHVVVDARYAIHSLVRSQTFARCIVERHFELSVIPLRGLTSFWTFVDPLVLCPCRFIDSYRSITSLQNSV